MPGRYDYKPLAFGYQMDSPYAGVLDYHIKLSKENGALDQIITKYKRGRQFCPDLRYWFGYLWVLHVVLLIDDDFSAESHLLLSIASQLS